MSVGIGHRCGRLVVVAEGERYVAPSTVGRGHVQWECLCDCGETKVVPQGALKAGTVRSCGCLRRELDLARQRRQERTCEQCGALFMARDSEIRKGGGRFCSRTCWAAQATSPSLLPGVADKISAAKTKTGRKTGLRQRQLEHAGVTIQAKGESACRNCGATGVLLQLHHAIPRSMWKGGILEPRNAIPLCVRCHMGWHHRYVTIYRDVFKPDEWECLTSAPLLGQNVMAWLDERYPKRTAQAEAA